MTCSAHSFIHSSQFLFPEAENFRVGEFNSLYTVHCLKIGTGGSIIGGGGPTGNTWYKNGVQQNDCTLRQFVNVNLKFSPNVNLRFNLKVNVAFITFMTWDCHN